MIDTNCDPDLISHPIPANDDAIRTIKLLTNIIANAVLDGKNARLVAEEETITQELEKTLVITDVPEEKTAVATDTKPSAETPSKDKAEKTLKEPAIKTPSVKKDVIATTTEEKKKAIPKKTNKKPDTEEKEA